MKRHLCFLFAAALGCTSAFSYDSGNEIYQYSAKNSYTIEQTATLQDARDGKTYRTVKIGNMVWMAENLNFNTPNSLCFNESQEYCDKYGRLYNFEEALNACPAEWHLPSFTEYEMLLNSVGGMDSASVALRSKKWCKIVSSESIEPEEKCVESTDAFGFNALPAGYYNIWAQQLEDEGEEHSLDIFDKGNAYLWSYTSDLKPVRLTLRSNRDYHGTDAYFRLTANDYGFSVRCVKNYQKNTMEKFVQQVIASISKTNIGKSMFIDSRDNQAYRILTIGSQEWMGENLRYASKGSMCYENNSDYCEKYGRLYTSDDIQGVCPDGWRLPQMNDFKVLIKNAGGTEIAGAILKSKGEWSAPGNGLDYYTFTLLPTGGCSSADDCSNMGSVTELWLENGDIFSAAFYRHGVRIYEQFLESNSYNPIRCIRK